MGTVRQTIEPPMEAWLARQHMFFVATAPLAADQHVNLSPKGLDTLRVLSPTRVAYLDLTGSGVETIAHVRENGRLTLMFCAFEGPPRIVRMYGRATVLVPGDADFDELAEGFEPLPGRRALIVLDVERVADSCGYAVPLYEHQGSRERLLEWAEDKGPAELSAYWATKNSASIDGLPGLPGVAEVAAAAEAS